MPKNAETATEYYHARDSFGALQTHRDVQNDGCKAAVAYISETCPPDLVRYPRDYAGAHVRLPSTHDWQ